MHRLVAFGNNAFGNLDPSPDAPLTLPPTDITSAVECDHILWHNYSTTIDPIGHLKIWGTSPQVASEARINPIAIPPNVKRILGQDTLLGYHLDNGYVYDLDGNRSALPWDDVVICGQGTVYTYSGPQHYRVRCGSVNIFKSLQALIDMKTYVEEHYCPLFSPRAKVSLFAAESRVFILVGGGFNTLYELEYGPPHDPSPTFRSMVQFEGLRFSVFAGSRNRFGIITDASELFIVDSRTRDTEQVELPEGADIRLAGLGSKSDIVITEDKVFVRGSSELGELGLSSESWVELQVPCDPRSITAVHTSRSSTILECS